MAKVVLVSLSYIVLKPDDWDEIDGLIPEWSAIEAAVAHAIGPGQQTGEGWISGSEGVLRPGDNWGTCAVCSCYISDINQPSRIGQLSRGTLFEGRLLCDEHLPPDHPDAF